MENAHQVNFVGALQERCMKNSLPHPSYTTVRKDGPDHSPIFTQQVSVPPYVEFGTGSNIQKAKSDAARKMLARLDDDSSSQPSKGITIT
jgi:dsRNA-specific ribonuclease